MVKKINISFLFVLLSIIFTYQKGQAEANASIDYITLSDKTTVDATYGTTSAKSSYSANVQFSINQRKTIFFGWGIYNVTTSDETNTQKLNYTTQDMGPSIRWFWGKGEIYFFNFIYGIQSKTSFNTGGTSEEWSGTNYLTQIGVSPSVSDSFKVSFSILYFIGSVSKKTLDSVQSNVSYSKAFMSPSIGLLYTW